ncbi:MAG: hypothetical protein WCQ95_02355 [Bacteroidota bacterium]
MKKIAILAFSMFSLFGSKAEINVGNSVEWLCADADIIAVGTLKSYTKCSTGNNLFLCTFQSTQILFGTSGNSLIFTINYIATDSLNKYVSQKTPMLVFLQQNESIYKSKKQETWWFAMEAYNSKPALVNLQSPSQLLISASGFSVLTSPQLIISYCQITLQKIAEYQVMGKSVFPNYLNIPFQTPAFNLLYSGSSCYLLVPDFMYAESKQKLY